MDLSNYKYIIGCDEVGYGCWAGPLVVVGVRAAPDWNLEGLNDSKKLSEKKRNIMREKLNDLILKGEIAWHLAERSNVQIDKVGVALALKESYVENFHTLHQPSSIIITDGILKFDNLGVDTYNKMSVIKADAKFPAVMAASILAKTYRDDKMKTLHQLHPQYKWNSNVGYGSKDHKAALIAHGPTTLHRFSYAPMKDMFTDKQLSLFSETK